MKKLLLVLLSPVLLFGQVKIESVTFSANGTASVLQKETVQIQSVSGAGGTITAAVQISGGFSLLLSAGYSDLLIKQNEYAMFAEWNWRSWKRYFGDINDQNFANATQWVQTVLKDSNYSAVFTPAQRLDFYPLLLEAAYTMPLGVALSVRAHAGAGLLFFTRRLYVNEEWSKKFRSVGYTYEYSYRNMAENRNGNPVAGSAGFTAEWQVSEYLSITAAARMLFIVTTPGQFNYSAFPARGMLTAGLGASFLY